MRIPCRKRTATTGFDVTPMIDVIFNLVIFFLVATLFARHDSSEAVSLPLASQVAEINEPPQRLMVTVQSHGAMSVKGTAVDIEMIKQMISEGIEGSPETFAVHIRADRAAQYGAVEPIMEACAARGVTHVGFKVIER